MARTFVPHVISRDSAIGGMEIDRSLRVDQGTSNVADGSFYSRTFADGNKRTFTISVWFKKCYTVGNIGDDSYTIISCGGGGTGSYAGRFGFDSYSSDQLQFVINNPAPTNNARARSTRRFRDNAWYHAVLAYDSTQSTESDRMKMYINGELETFDSPTYPSQNYEGYFNNNVLHRVGATSSWSTGQDLGQFNGYLAEFHFIDGTAYDASYFGFTEQQTEVWRPKRVTGLTYGTNGFYLDFKDNTSTTTIGYDKSGNANHFSPHDVQVSDSVLDSPTNDFCMMSGLNKNSGLSHGNLQFYKWNDSSAALVTCQASMDIPNTGKWVWEQRWTGYQKTRYWAITRRMRAQGEYLDSSAYVYYDMYNGKTVSGLNGSVVTTLTGGQTSYGDNTTRYWLMALDMDDMKARFYVNNVLQSTIAIPELPDDGKGNYVWTWTSSNGGSGSDLDDRFNFGQDATYFGAVALQNKYDASGLGQFYNTVPDGHKCLCTKNLPARTDVIVEPQKHFDTLLYTGDGASVRSVTGLEFQPDMVWVKSRSQSSTNHGLTDSVKTDPSYPSNHTMLYPNLTNAETGGGDYFAQTTATGRDPFLPDGFLLNNNTSGNNDGSTYVAWCWKAGGAAVTNTVGNISAQVSANDEAGFSIITYTGDGNSSGNVGTGLRSTQPLDWAIVKRRDDTSDWQVGHIASGQSSNFAYHTNLNDTSALSGSAPYHMGTQSYTNGDRLYLATGGLTSSATYVAYVWQERPGYSKFGSYTGNGNDDGTNVVTGFKPAWLLIKNISSASTDWILKDTKIATSNVMEKALKANTTDAEASSLSSVDFLSNGFKIRNNGSFTNQSGETYIYMAFADQTSLNQYNLAVNGR